MEQQGHLLLAPWRLFEGIVEKHAAIPVCGD
jgi:hypothetical protein